jgi:hypothetical protein
VSFFLLKNGVIIQQNECPSISRTQTSCVLLPHSNRLQPPFFFLIDPFAIGFLGASRDVEVVAVVVLLSRFSGLDLPEGARPTLRGVAIAAVLPVSEPLCVGGKMGRAMDSRRCGVRSPSLGGSDISRCASNRSGRHVAWWCFARLLAARCTRTVDAESARVRPVFLAPSNGVGSSSPSGTDAEDKRLPLLNRLPWRRMLEPTLLIEFRFSSPYGSGDPGGVDTGEEKVAPFEGETCMLGERVIPAVSFSLSSYLKYGDQPSLKATHIPVITMMLRNRSSVSQCSLPSASSSIVSRRMVEDCFGVLKGVAADGSGILKVSLISNCVLLRVAMTGCFRLLGEIVLKLNFFFSGSIGFVPSLFRFCTHLTVKPRPCSSVLKNS